MSYHWFTAKKIFSSTSLLIVLVGLVGFMVACFIQKDALQNADLIQNDARIHIWWMDHLDRCEEVQDDALINLMRSKSWRNIGFTGLFRLFSGWISAFALSKILSVILLPITLMLITLLGDVSGKRSAGLAAAFIYCSLALTSWSSGIVVFDGLQRSFRDPILLTGLLALAIPSRVLFGISCAFACLFYPICLPVLVGTDLLMLALSHKEKLENKIIKVIIVVIMLGVLAGLSAASIYCLDKPFYGYTGSVYSNPRFGDSGREPVFGPPGHEFSIVKPFLVSKSTGFFGQSKSEARTLVVLMFIAVVLWFRSSAGNIPNHLKCFVFSGISLYLLAWVVAFTTGRFLLYFPNRYNVSLLFLILLVGLLIASQKKTILGASIQLLAISLILLPRISSIEFSPGYIQPEPWEVQLMEYLEELPGRELIAGPPDLLNNIPCFTCSSIYLSFEMDTEMRSDWSRERFTKLFDVYYTSDPEDLFKFSETEGVTHLLVDMRTLQDGYIAGLQKGLNRFYLEPHSSMVRQNLAGLASAPILRSPPPERICFKWGTFYLVDIQR